MRLAKRLIIVAIIIAANMAFAGSVVTQRVVNVHGFVKGSTTLSLSGQMNDAAMKSITDGNGMAIYNYLDNYLVFPTLLPRNKVGFGSKSKVRTISVNMSNGKFQWTEKDVTPYFAFATGEERIKPDKATFKSTGTLQTSGLTALEQKKLTVYDQLCAEQGLGYLASLAFTLQKKGKNYKFSYNENKLQAKVLINPKGKITAQYSLPPDVAYPALLENEYVFTNMYDYSLEIIGEGGVYSDFYGPDQVEFSVTENIGKFRFFTYDGIRVTNAYMTLELENDTEVAAVFGNYDFSLYASGDGSASFEFTGQDEVEIKALEGGAPFRYFNVNGVKYTDSTTALTLQEDTVVEAVFGTYGFKTEVVGEGSIDFEFIEPDLVEVRVPEGSKFFRYFLVNGQKCTEETMLLSLQEDTVVEAVFGTYDLTVEIIGNGSVYVEFTGPDDVEVKALEGDAPFRYFTVNGEKCTEDTMVLSLQEDTAIEAVFGTYELTLGIVGDGSADVEFTGPDEAEVKVSEGNAPFRYFTVNGERITESTMFLSLTTNTVVEAVFGTYGFKTEVVGEGSIDFEFIEPDLVEVRVPEGSKFFRYFLVNGQKCTEETMLLSLQEDTVVEAVFGTYNLETVVFGNGSVTVEFVGPDEIVATAVDGEELFYSFEWDDNAVFENPVSFTMKNDTVLSATFKAPEYLVIDISKGKDAEAWPVRFETHEPDVSGDVCRTTEIWLKYIAPGEFKMGSPETEVGRYDDEYQHEVTLTKGFFMGVFEVTQAQYEIVTGYNNSVNKGYDRPVEMVSYDSIVGTTTYVDDPNAFLTIVKNKTGLAIDLPTEAQWEYACRAATTSALYTGQEITENVRCANVAQMCRYRYNRDDGMGGYTEHTRVGSYPANPWGLYDMCGNVWEWTKDYYGTYNVGPETDPTGPSTGVKRILRGGSWAASAQNCRSARRRSYDSNASYDGGESNFGFRLSFTKE